MAQGSQNLTGHQANKLTNARELYVDLSTTRDANNKILFNGAADKILQVSGILPIIRGGTGNNAFTASRLVYSNTASQLSSTSITSDGAYLGSVSYLSINTAHQTDYRLYVNGNTYFNGNTTHNGIAYFANGTTYYINNSANGYLNALQLKGNLTFDATGTTGTAGGIYWSGSTDGAQLYYTVPSSDAGILVINMTDDANARLSLRTQGTERFAITSGGISADLSLTFGNANIGVRRVGRSVNWVDGRDSAIVASTSINGYGAVVSVKTTNGSWDIGAYNHSSYTDDLLFSYCTDTDHATDTYNNRTTAQIKFLENGHIVAALDGNASTASKWATACTLTIGGTGKSVDGSADVSWGKAEILGSSTDAKFYRGDQTWSNTLNGAFQANGTITANGGYLKSTLNNNTVTIGSANTSWCHIENSVNIPFYFNRAIHVNGDIYYYNTKVHMSSTGFYPPKGGGIYWDPYVESASDASDVTQIIQVASGVAGGTELRIQQANDTADVINLMSPAYIYMNSKKAFTINDAWLRINDGGGFSSGVYFGTSIVRTDGEFWSDRVRIVDDWVGFYNAVQGTTRYGYIQANANRMYFRKENGVSSYGFDFNSHLYTTGHYYASNAGPCLLLACSDLTNVKDAKNGLSANREQGMVCYSKDYGSWMGDFKQGYTQSNGQIWSRMYLRNYKTDGTQVNNYIYLYANKDGGTSYAIANQAAFRAAISTWALVSDSYNTFMPANGTTNDWYKFNTAADNGAHGILPSNSGGAGSGHSYIGTSSWYWKYSYIDEMYGRNLRLSGANNGIYFTGTKNTYRMIRFIDNTADEYGNGISIGGGGLVVVGAGESADTIITNVTSAGGTEETYIAADGNIHFYPGQNSYDASAKLTMTPSRFWAGVNGNTAREAQVGCQSGAGQIYFWSHAATSGSRGIYIPAHGTGGARGIIEANTNNYVYVRGNDTWGNQVLLTSNWIGFYKDALSTGTRYGYIQCNANRMYFRKENGVDTYHFDFNGHIYTTGEHITGGSQGFRLIHNNRGAFWHWNANSGQQWFYLMFTAAGSGMGSWTSVRAFYANADTGYTYHTRAYSAVWNDYAEFRSGDCTEPGRVVIEQVNGIMSKCQSRLCASAKVISDTYGFAIGETKECKTPIAVSGRVLVYPYQNRENYELGAAVCSAPNGTVDIMTRDEIMMYPERIIGTVSEIPDYEEWQCGGDVQQGPREKIKVNGRIWIYVK